MLVSSLNQMAQQHPVTLRSFIWPLPIKCMILITARMTRPFNNYQPANNGLPLAL